MRALLRKLIGWNELDIRFAPADSSSKVMSHINALKAEIQELKNAQPFQPGKITTRERRNIPDTWEQVVAMFAENAQNFEEN